MRRPEKAQGNSQSNYISFCAKLSTRRDRLNIDMVAKIFHWSLADFLTSSGELVDPSFCENLTIDLKREQYPIRP